MLEAGGDGMISMPEGMADWALLRLARKGRIEEVEVDTNHFKGTCVCVHVCVCIVWVYTYAPVRRLSWVAWAFVRAW